LALPLSAVALLASCARGSGDPVLVGTLERDRIELAAQGSDPIVAIEIKEGEHVRAGQVLVRQEPLAADAHVAEARATAEQARQRLAELVTGPRVEDILAARARVSSAQAALVRDEADLVRAENLVKSRLVSAAQFDAARAARDGAAAALREAEAALTAQLRGTRREQLDQARSALAAAEAATQALEVAQGRLTVKASRDAVVEALPYKVGEQPPMGAPVAILLADGAPYARVYVPEPQRARVKRGDRAAVKVDGVATTFTGIVRYVASAAAFTPYYALTQADRSRLAYLAEIDLMDPAARDLPAGVPLEVRLADGADGAR
jgi:HlyD family secretion protein